MRFPMQHLRRPNPVFSDEYRLIVEVLKRARESAGLSQRGLASQLGKSASHVARIEAGQRRVDTLELVRMAEAFGVSPEALVATIAARLRAPSDGCAGRSAGLAPHIGGLFKEASRDALA